MLISIVLPVYNEERLLAISASKLDSFLKLNCPHAYEIVIADNGSNDRTPEIAQSLARSHSNLRSLHLKQKGRGRALKTAWLQSKADILAYMDADLSTGLEGFPALIGPLCARQCDVAVGSRLHKSSRTSRCLKRELISRFYNILLRSVLHTHLSDAQCGFKAITREAARTLLEMVEDTDWFFDTELLILAEHYGYKLLEIPVHWRERADTRVDIFSTVIKDLQGIRRMRSRLKSLSLASSIKASKECAGSK